MSDDNKFSLGDILWEYADYTPPEIPVKKPSAGGQLPKGTPGGGMTSPQPQAQNRGGTAGQVLPANQARPGGQPLPANQSLPANQAPVSRGTAPSSGQAKPAAAPTQPPAQGKPATAPPRPSGQGTPTAPPSQANQQNKPTGAPPQSNPQSKPAGTPPQSNNQGKPASTPPQPNNQGKPAGTSPQPNNQSKPAGTPSPQPAAQGKPADGQPQAAPQGTPASGQPQPSNGPSPAQGQPTPQGESASSQDTSPDVEVQGEATPELGIGQDDGPELIAFTPDPKAAEAQEGGEGQEEQTADGQPAAQTAPQQPSPAGPGAAPKGPRSPGAGGGPSSPSPSGAGAGTQAIPGFRPFRERKAKTEPPPPPDALPNQLVEEYGPGLHALKSKTTASILLCLPLLALALLDSGVIPPLQNLLPANILLWVSFALFLVCGGLCLDVLREGLVQLTNLSPNGDTLALLAAAFTLVDGVTMVLTLLRESAVPFFAPCSLVLAFHLLGQYCERSAKFQSARVASSVSQSYLVTQDPNVLSGQPAFRKWMGPPRGFGSQLRTVSQPEQKFRRLTPVLIVACLVLALITTVAHHQPKLVLWSLSALFTAAATLGAALDVNLPLRLLGGRLSKLGVALAGWPGLMAGKGCKAALLMDQDIYPPGTVTLTGSRVFGSLPMDRTVAYAASVIRASGSGLSYLFDKLLRAEGSNYLPINKIVLQETGLIGQCQDQQILVGNSDFMSRQGIALPPGIKAKDAVFCAVDRELVGMFVLKYTLHTTILPALQALVSHRFNPVMVTRDFNLNPHRLRLWGRLPMDQLTFPDLQRRVTLSGPHQVHGTTILAVLCREGMAPFSQAIIAAKRIRRAAAFSSIFVRVGACVGVLLTATLSSAGALGAMSAWNLALFLLLWLVPVLLISLWTVQY